MLSKEYRLVKRGSYAFVRSHGTKQNEKLISLAVVRGRCKKIGFIVSNKVGKAVRRNKVKRRMRSIIQELLPDIANGQMVFITRAGITELSFVELRHLMINLLSKSKLLISK